MTTEKSCVVKTGPVEEVLYVSKQSGSKGYQECLDLAPSFGPASTITVDVYPVESRFGVVVVDPFGEEK